MSLSIHNSQLSDHLTQNKRVYIGAERRSGKTLFLADLMKENARNYIQTMVITLTVRQKEQLRNHLPQEMQEHVYDSSILGYDFDQDLLSAYDTILIDNIMYMHKERLMQFIGLLNNTHRIVSTGEHDPYRQLNYPWIHDLFNVQQFKAINV